MDKIETMTPMNHITKLLLRINMLLARNKVKPEIAEGQCGLWKVKEQQTE